MIEIIAPIITLCIALFILIKGADAFIDGAKDVGASLGMSSFAIGVLIVGMGTSLPEFASSFAAALQGSTEIVIANVVGSNITNILLIVGIVALVGGTIRVKKDLLVSELPVFFIATTHFLLALWDGVIDRVEAFLLLGTFLAYLWYLFVESADDHPDAVSVVRPKLERKSVMLIVFGLVGLLVGAKYSVDMIVEIGTLLSVPVAFLSITVLAIGTSLPELLVSLKAVLKKEHELGIGNIFGSNVFNMLLVVGVPGVLMQLQADAIVMTLGLPVLLAASLILFVAGLSKRIMRWEGIMMVMFFAFFIVKLTAFV
jgi:cation:H+ antiporter